MRETLLRQVEMEYEARRAKNRAEEACRLAKAEAADPEIAALTARRAALFAQKMRNAFERPAEALLIAESLKEEVSALQSALRERLSLCGFPETYLQPVYECPACRDTGYVGEPVRERCACFLRRLRALQAGACEGLDPCQTFEAYDEAVYPDMPLGEGAGDTQRGYMARMRERCASYAALYPLNPKRNLLFLGMSGLGKTYLMNCVGNAVRQKGGEVMKLTAYQLTERMRASVFDRDPDAFSVLLDVPLLLLDDLGAEPMLNNITVEQLFTLLNERDLSGLHTVVSTNLQPDELQRRYTERICSRLFDKRNTAVLPFKGKDVRLA